VEGEAHAANHRLAAAAHCVLGGHRWLNPVTVCARVTSSRPSSHLRASTNEELRARPAALAGVIVPLPFRGVLGLGRYLELGFLYKLYMVLLVIFCSNSINILAGLNGLEAGQTFMLACAVLAHNLYQLGGQASLPPEGRSCPCLILRPCGWTQQRLIRNFPCNP
jgi:hypothetical protein